MSAIAAMFLCVCLGSCPKAVWTSTPLLFCWHCPCCAGLCRSDDLPICHTFLVAFTLGMIHSNACSSC